MATEIRNLKLSELEYNEGQFYGLPKNPRWIRDARFEALKKSIEDAPEMLELRELLIYPLSDLEGHEDKFIVIGGNMRLRACRELGYTEVPCKVLPLETPVKKLREYAIKDNEAFGQNDFDVLANEWDMEELQEFGMELDYLQTSVNDYNEENHDDFFEEIKENKASSNSVITIEIPVEYEDKIEDIRSIVEISIEEYKGCKVK